MTRADGQRRYASALGPRLRGVAHPAIPLPFPMPPITVSAEPSLLHFLDGLDVRQRRLAWERILGETEWPRAGTFVAEIDKDAVGFVNVGSTRDGDEDPATVGEVTAIYVLGEAWGTGAGRRLMSAAVDSLTQAGFDQATLWVLDKNHRTRRFYETGGWRPDGAVKRDDLRGFPLTEVRYRRLFS